MKDIWQFFFFSWRWTRYTKIYSEFGMFKYCHK